MKLIVIFWKLFWDYDMNMKEKASKRRRPRPLLPPICLPGTQVPAKGGKNQSLSLQTNQNSVNQNTFMSVQSCWNTIEIY